MTKHGETMSTSFDQIALTSVSMLISFAEDILHKSCLLAGLVRWLCGQARRSLLLPEENSHPHGNVESSQLKRCMLKMDGRWMKMDEF